MTKQIIEEIEEAIPYHINYSGNLSSNYLKIMDRLAWGYSGSKAEKVSKLLGAYYKAVGVENLNGAIKRLKRIRGD